MYIDNYHEKFYKRDGNKDFTGRIFNEVEFLHHLSNINFRFECGEIEKLSDEAINKIKNKFKFTNGGYFCAIDGIVMFGDNYADDFIKLVKKYGDKYGYCENTEKRNLQF